MTVIKKDDLIQSVADALQYISYYHPVDFIQAINAAYEREENQAAKDAMAQILINSRMCAEGHRPICQDTGIVTVFLEIGMDVRWPDATLSIEDMCNEGVRRGYTNPDNPLRASVLDDPLCIAVVGQVNHYKGAGIVREMVEESREVQSVVAQTQTRLQDEHARATELTDRVRELEDEIRKLSDEVSTDPLTQIANRRGLMRAFEAEQARVERQGTPLAVGLLDVDNFKKLNDQLGHQTGDEALKFLARRVSESLRPVDVVARYGGEEFVVMLPDTPLEEAQLVLTRLQRNLSAEGRAQEMDGKTDKAKGKVKGAINRI